MIILKKFNNKGFILVETVVVSAFVLMIFVLVFRNGVPMIEEYKKLENYDDVDSLYAANLVKDVIKKDENYYKIVDAIQGTSSVPALDYIDLSECAKTETVLVDGVKKEEVIDLTISDLNLCETVKLRANITEVDKIYLTHANPSRIKGKVLQDDRRFNGYIDYLNNSYNEELASDPYMIIITRTIEGNNPYLDEEEQEKFEDIKTVKYGSIGFQ